MPSLRHILANNLRTLMNQNEALSSQTKLANASKITQSHIGRILRMESDPTTDKVESLAKAFRITPAQLLSRELGSAPHVVEQKSAAPYAANDPLRAQIEELLDDIDAEGLQLALMAIETALNTRKLLKPDKPDRNFRKRSVR